MQFIVLSMFSVMNSTQMKTNNFVDKFTNTYLVILIRIWLADPELVK